MPTIISSTKLRNEYAAVSEQCHSQPDPIFVTRNGCGDLAIMSMEAYERISGRGELLAKLAEGEADIAAGRSMSLDEARRRLHGDRP